MPENFFRDFRDLDWLLDEPKTGKISRYPLTDLSIDNDETVFVDIAVAGFGPEDIDIEMQGDILIITGSKEQPDSNSEYINRYISTSNFERKIKLGQDHLSGNIDASYENGILTVKITKSEKPRKLISIKHS